MALSELVDICKKLSGNQLYCHSDYELEVIIHNCLAEDKFTVTGLIMKLN